ncbi:MAG: hypothetical protein GTO16_07445 [Candidatus Aminicenantes bacterium]|nr:hypothetical protein [Candidatus Aminicenantes bacterium]
MFRCQIVNFLFTIFPFKIWQDFLLQKHIQNCPACQENLASLEETKSLLIQGEDVGGLEDLWPKVKLKLAEQERKERFFQVQRLAWAVGAAFLVLAIVLGIWFYQLTPRGKTPEEDIISPFQIKYIRIYDQPARTYIFQPQDSNMIIIWAEKNI